MGCALILNGCSVTEGVKNALMGPRLAPIENPTEREDYKVVAMPLPEKKEVARSPNSLWTPGSKSFFKDQRASNIGDILTINVAVNDSASLQNSTNRSRNSSSSTNVNKLFGQEGKILPDGAAAAVGTAANLLDTVSKPTYAGSGRISRNESINMKVAAVVTQVFENGNMLVIGRQQVKVNHEMRELLVSGVVRREDIHPDNTVSSDKLAEARISYGGEGHIHDAQRPRWGNMLVDALMPF